ncbi:protein arginine n-methyltransferase 3 [Moniliophthora roreri MCA 2997]|uniref:type I protein arginine methyltransferase n=1 Tax=Moniliophthora roreri (strain MCA 2997) TaxID=1381753 RepID=V2WW80_MONRO|nr:protein arginine n-methyltransferase 3 [Moniliophthora roreri MCA 2997]
MSIHLHAAANLVERQDDSESAPSSEEDDDDQTWEDWVSDSNSRQPCRSLFEDRILQSAEAALAYDKSTFGFSLDETCAKLSLDVHGRIRLINFIRLTKPSPENVSHLTGSESFFSSDEYLRPIIEDDPLLQLQSGDWSDSEDESTNSDPEKRIRALEQKLAQAREEFNAYRALISQRLNLIEAASDERAEAEAKSRDDDSHYFDSYGANDIHAVMIQDQVRTSTYARYILTTPTVFEGATVLDVGCGTGILSLFAARAGAKRVIAVDASDIASKAERIVRVNELQNVITVINGKIEDIKLPEDIEKVDVIISEWMGYALLYESMLDSVLVAKSRFLKPGGIMAPSQCKMMLGLCDASEIVKERMTFWNDVYGFDLSTMAEDIPEEAIVDVVGPHTMLSDPYTVKDLYIPDLSPRQLDFTSSFKLVSTVQRRTKVTAFVLYFDTFFTRSGQPIPSGTEVKNVGEGEVVVAELWPVGGKPAPQRRGKEKEVDTVTSFSTGPRSIPTHWKQTLFILREPFIADEGTVVLGQFVCKKNQTNSRELDVEIRYTVKASEAEEAKDQDVVVQIFKVR